MSKYMNPNPTMTKQEAFDRMVTHLAQQKERSINGRNQCAYRGRHGRKCPVGALLSNKLVNGSDEGTSVCGIWDRAKVELALSDCEESDAIIFYEHMQDSHDGSLNAGSLREELTEVAKRYNLDQSLIATITEWS